MPQEIKIKVSPNGEDVEVEAFGFTGGACKDWSQDLINALGPMEKEKLKDSYFKTEHAGQTVGV